MHKYEVLEVVNEGAYGIVMKCRSRSKGHLVAIKKFKETEYEDELVRKTGMRERSILEQISTDNRPHIVRLEESFKRQGRLYLVFEYVEQNLLELLDEFEEGIPEKRVRIFIFQILTAIEYLHSLDIIHRDIKLENCLVGGPLKQQLKLCDFGFARSVAQARRDGPYTEYVSTRWYRAPELIVSGRYGKPVDIWAIGCIMGELLDANPMFPGDTDLDMCFLIQKHVGHFPRRLSTMFRRNPRFRQFVFPGARKEKSLRERYDEFLSPLGIDILERMLQVDPRKRITAREALQHPYFEDLVASTSCQPTRQQQPQQQQQTKGGHPRRVSTAVGGSRASCCRRKVLLSIDSNTAAVVAAEEQQHASRHLHSHSRGGRAAAAADLLTRLNPKPKSKLKSKKTKKKSRRRKSDGATHTHTHTMMMHHNSHSRKKKSGVVDPHALVHSLVMRIGGGVNDGSSFSGGGAGAGAGGTSSTIRQSRGGGTGGAGAGGAGGGSSGSGSGLRRQSMPDSNDGHHHHRRGISPRRGGVGGGGGGKKRFSISPTSQQHEDEILRKAQIQQRARYASPNRRMGMGLLPDIRPSQGSSPESGFNAVVGGSLAGRSGSPRRSVGGDWKSLVRDLSPRRRVGVGGGGSGAVGSGGSGGVPPKWRSKIEGPAVRTAVRRRSGTRRKKRRRRKPRKRNHNHGHNHNHNHSHDENRARSPPTDRKLAHHAIGLKKGPKVPNLPNLRGMVQHPADDIPDRPPPLFYRQTAAHNSKRTVSPLFVPRRSHQFRHRLSDAHAMWNACGLDSSATVASRF